MNSNFLKDYMDLDEFLAVKDLCAGLSRTESDYSEDEIDQDIAGLVNDEDIPSICRLPSSYLNTPQLSPSCFCSASDTDEGRGESVSSENPASCLSSCESLNSNENDSVASPRKRKRKSLTNHTQKAAPRKRRRRTESAGEKKQASGTATAIENEDEAESSWYEPCPVGHRSARQSVENESKDDKYWERRRKNNQAAKRSRDLKREKEMCVAERAASLEEENRELREEVQQLREYLRTLDEKVECKSSTD